MCASAQHMCTCACAHAHMQAHEHSEVQQRLLVASRHGPEAPGIQGRTWQQKRAFQNLERSTGSPRIGALLELLLSATSLHGQAPCFASCLSPSTNQWFGMHEEVASDRVSNSACTQSSRTLTC